MSRFYFTLGTPGDEAELRAIARSNPMPGGIAIAYHREPDYFLGARIQGHFQQTLVARDSLTGKIAGLASRAVKPAYINSRLIDMGYLSGLKLLAPYRKGTLLARGYRFLQELHKDRRASFYLQTIIEDNYSAREQLTSGRAGLPFCFELGRFCTFAIKLGRKKKQYSRYEIVRGTPQLLDQIVDCLQRNGKEKNFYPHYSREDFSGDLTKDFAESDFFVALDNTRVVGVLGKWNQSAFKQNVVAGYSGAVRHIKVLYNLCATLAGWSKLPPVGKEIKSFFVSFVAVDNNSPEIFRALLRAVYNDALGQGFAYFLVGLHSSDPLAEACYEYHPLTYNSRLYAVSWEELDKGFLGDKIPYLELATL